jgi:hypothetical protein
MLTADEATAKTKLRIWLAPTYNSIFLVKTIFLAISLLHFKQQSNWFIVVLLEFEI